MNYEKIDEHFRARLHDTVVEPPDFVWPNVEASLRRKRKLRIFGWFFGSSLAVAGLCALWMGRESWPAPSGVARTGTTEARLESPPSTAGQASTPSAHAPGEVPKPGQILSASTGSDSPQLASAETREAKAAPTWRVNFAKKSATAARRALAPEHLAQVRSTGASDEFFEKGAAPLAAPAIPAPEAPEAEKQAILSTDLLSTDLLPVASSEQKPPYRFPIIKPLWRKKQEARHCYSFARYGHAWMLDAYAGYAYADRSLVATRSDFDAYRNSRDASERFGFGFSGGLRGSLVWGPLMLRTGLHYTQFTEVFDYQAGNTTQIINVQQILINPDGTSDTSFRSQTLFGDRVKRTYNRFGTLDIPVTLGAEMRFGKVGLSLNGGLAANLLFWKRGSMLAPQLTPVDFTPSVRNAQTYFKINTGISALASAQAFYHLSPRTRIFVEPYFQKILKPVSANDYPLSQRYQIFGSNIGITRILD